MKFYAIRQRAALLVGLLCAQFFALFANTPTYAFLSEHSYGVDYEALQVNLGTSADPAENVSSVSFSLNYDISKGSLWVDLSGSWMDQNGSASYTLDADTANKVVQVTIYRTSGGPITGYGEIGVVVMDRGGIIDNMDIRGAPILHSALVSQEQPEALVFPNPAADRLYVRAATGVDHLALLDLNGRRVRSQDLEQAGTGSQVDLQVADLPRGMYILRTTSGQHYSDQKVVLR